MVGFARSTRRKLILLAGLLLLCAGAGGFYFLHAHLAERDFQRRYQAAQALASKDDLAEAYEEFKALAAIRPADPELLLQLARTARQQDHYLAALKALEAYEANGGSSATALFERRLAKLQQGVAAIAPQLRSTLEGDGPDTDLALEALCRGFIASGRFPEAYQYSDEWIEKFPRRVRAWVLKADSLLERQQASKALACVDQALELNPENVWALFLKVNLDSYYRDPLRARDTLIGLHRREPDNKKVLISLAELQVSCGELAEAEATAGKLDALERDLGATVHLRGKLALLQDNPAQAEKWFKIYLKADKNDPNVVREYIDCLRLQDKTAEKEEWEEHYKFLLEAGDKIIAISKALAAQPEDADLRFQLGEAYLKISHYKEGIYWVHLALQANPDHAGAHAALARYYRAIHQEAEARKHDRPLPR